MEFENCSSVKAKTRRRTPAAIRSSTWAFTFSTPASANTTGGVSEGVAPRPASSSTATPVHGCERLGDSPCQNPSREVVDHRVQVRAGSVEQANDGGVDVPHLVGSRRSNAHLRLCWVHAEPGATPAELPHETVASRGRGPDLAEPLREDRERAGRDVPILGRGHHVPDRPNFERGQSMGRRVRTGRLIGKRTRGLQPPPGMESTRRQLRESQERPQWHKLTGPIHGAQDPDLGAFVGQPLVRQPESGAAQERECQPTERGELLHVSSEFEDFLLEL